MNASDARLLANESRNSHVIQPFLNRILDRIQTLAKMGKLELNHPFETVDKKFPTIEEQTAITMALTKLGYVVKEHPDPDPGHPCSHAYTSVSW